MPSFFSAAVSSVPLSCSTTADSDCALPASASACSFLSGSTGTEWPPSARSGSGAVHPCSRAISRPTRLAGPAAGPASLVGLKIARDRGWTAPEGAKPAELGSGAETKTEAVEQADTSRAETETTQQEGKE